MRTNIQIKLLQGDRTISNYLTGVDLRDGALVSEAKTICKSKFTEFVSDKIEKEVFYHGNKELQDTDVVPNKSGLEYNLILK